jgi:hypothetical protein
MTDTSKTPGKTPGKTPVRLDRRGFLRAAGVAAATVVPLSANAEQLVRPTSHQAPARYQESEHVKRFYDLNRR